MKYEGFFFAQKCMHVSTCSACTRARARTQTLLINSGDQSLGTLKISWRSDFIWLRNWGVLPGNTFGNKQTNRQTDNKQTLLKFNIEGQNYKSCHLFVGRHKTIRKYRENPNTNPTPNPTPIRGQTFTQLNHIGSSTNFKDIFPIIQGHDLWYQRWPLPSILQSGFLNVLQVPNLGQIMSDLHQPFKIYS